MFHDPLAHPIAFSEGVDDLHTFPGTVGALFYSDKHTDTLAELQEEVNSMNQLGTTKWGQNLLAHSLGAHGKGV
jgi:hypothetical protein